MASGGLGTALGAAGIGSMLGGSSKSGKESKQAYKWAKDEYESLKGEFLADPFLKKSQDLASINYPALYMTRGQRQADLATQQLAAALAARGGSSAFSVLPNLAQARSTATAGGLLTGFQAKQGAIQQALQNKWNYLLQLFGPMAGVTSQQIGSSAGMYGADVGAGAQVLSSLLGAFSGMKSGAAGGGT